MKESERLSPGAVVREEQLVGKRLLYGKVSTSISMIFISLSLSIYIYIYIYPSIYLPTYLSIYIYICIYRSVCLSVYLSAGPRRGPGEGLGERDPEGPSPYNCYFTYFMFIFFCYFLCIYSFLLRSV